MHRFVSYLLGGGTILHRHKSDSIHVIGYSKHTQLNFQLAAQTQALKIFQFPINEIPCEVGGLVEKKVES